MATIKVEMGKILLAMERQFLLQEEMGDDCFSRIYIKIITDEKEITITNNPNMYSDKSKNIKITEKYIY